MCTVASPAQTGIDPWAHATPGRPDGMPVDDLDLLVLQGWRITTCGERDSAMACGDAYRSAWRTERRSLAGADVLELWGPAGGRSVVADLLACGHCWHAVRRHEVGGW